ncbi:glycosyltransferase family 2 protein [Aestuariibaculum suncheonense]|uniref:Glycosyltransferase n=1 Tax=Aestuariibaculum suncheonense TaxID=1028745 RepID=A0A8J6QN77_9FLAO|nr:glycosyltransferase [Aestuariibaculum suncheonense]MBD0837021.1 glycosyltransferase [Aestuariibaculum suncheonense]
MLLSVRLQTYNHAAYIEAALQGIEAQATDFDFEVVIGDDFSTDDTLEIIKQFISLAKNSKITWRVLERQVGDTYWTKRQELGRLYNFTNILEHCTGTYVALLDGDDYWTDPLKLQKQVDFLEYNNEFSGVSSNCNVVYHDFYKKPHLFGKCESKVYKFNDLISARHFHTATFVFKRLCVENGIPTNILSGDRFIFMKVACFGKIKLLEDVTSVYRKNEGGISSKVTSRDMRKDYNMIGHIKQLRNDNINNKKLLKFISYTVLSYSHTIYIEDYLKALLFYAYASIKEKRGFKIKLRSLIKTYELSKSNFYKVQFFLRC